MTDAGAEKATEQAYSGAPRLSQELSWYMQQLAEKLAAGQVIELRECLLRQAALQDRTLIMAAAEVRAQGSRGDEMAREVREPYAECHRDAAHSASALMAYDRDHSTHLGDIGADAVDWEAPGGLAAYVRREYQAWLRRPWGH